MTPEETLNQQKWAVLQDVKEHYQINTRNEGDVKCILPDFTRAKTISPDRIGDILRFIEKEGAFKIQKHTNQRRNAKYLIINPSRFEEVYKEYEQKNNSEEDELNEEDIFSYDGGLSRGYENSNLELFIQKKILLEHKRRDDLGFWAKELSFNNNSLKDICEVINKLMEDKILYLSANTRPEKFEDREGIEDKNGFINWNMVEELDKKTKRMSDENECVIFDTSIIDEIRLKGRIDIAIEEFMNNKVYSSLGYLVNKSEVEENSYSYQKQREIVIDEIVKDEGDELIISLNNFSDKKVEVLKTLLALEKENLVRITELRSNPMYDQGGNFLGKWTNTDNPVAHIYALKTNSNKQEPMLMKIVGMPELQIKGFEERVILQKPKNKRVQLMKFPPDLKWGEITIKFLNQQEVIIKFRDETLQATYETMGFQDEKRKLPNKQWDFLCLLAIKNGELSWDNNQELPIKQINSIKKQKQLLADALKAYFQINSDEPFHDYKKEKAYRIKLNLIPEPEAKDID
jgi:hypothetical protein